MTQSQSSQTNWHCLYNGGRADIFELTIKLAKEYRLAVRVFDRATGEPLRRQGLPTSEHPVVDTYKLDIVGKKEILYALCHSRNRAE